MAEMISTMLIGMAVCACQYNKLNETLMVMNIDEHE